MNIKFAIFNFILNLKKIMHLPRRNNLLIFWRRAKIYISRICSFTVIRKHINLKMIKIKAIDTHSKKIIDAW